MDVNDPLQLFAWRRRMFVSRSEVSSRLAPAFTRRASAAANCKGLRQRAARIYFQSSSAAPGQERIAAIGRSVISPLTFVGVSEGCLEVASAAHG